jgi:ketosteroid isomerase-like protein
MRRFSLRNAAIGAAVLGPLAYSWALRRALEYNLARVRAGDPRPLLRFYAEDVRFRFPGDSSWAVEISSKRELERWIARFIEVGLELHPEQVVIAGPPWNTTFCIRCTDHAKSPEGEIVYENRAVIWGRISWGRVREYEVYEDTQKSAAFDEYLARHEKDALGS